MKKNVIKISALVFAVLCLLGLVYSLCLAVELPTTVRYTTGWGTYTRTYSGSFDVSYLSSIILLSFGLFWGLVLFFSVNKEDAGVKECDKCSTKTLEEKANATKVSEDNPETTEVPEEKTNNED